MTKYYKVLREHNKKLVSANIYFYQRYFTNKVNLPRNTGSKLFVFEDVYSAHCFQTTSMYDYPCFVYEVKVTNPVKIDGSILFPSDVSDSWKTDRSTIVNSWKTYLETDRWKGIHRIRTTISPKNTILCDSIKIIKRLNENEILQSIKTNKQKVGKC